MSGSADFELRPIFTFSNTWLIIGCLLLLIIILWYFYVFYITRNKKVKTLNNLAPKVIVQQDIGSIKQKYILLINETEQKYNNKEYSLRLAHQTLSHLLRIFVYEVKGHRVDTLTLAELRQTKYTTLSNAIQEYYLPEFSQIEQGSVSKSANIAREVVTSWS